MVEIYKEEVRLEHAGVPKAYGSVEEIDRKKERRVVWKQDLLIIPILWIIFFLGYLVSQDDLPLLIRHADQNQIWRIAELWETLA